MKKLIEHLCSNILLKTGSLLGALIFWYFFSGMHATTLSVTVPICFYNTTDNRTIDAPENITVVLHGQRSHLRSINQSELAVHVDAEQLAGRVQALELCNAQLFLPDTIKLVHYFPSPLIINVTSDSKKTV